MVIQSKTVPKFQVGLPAVNNAPLKTFLSSTLQVVEPRTAEVRNVAEAPAVQRPVRSGAVRNIPVVHEVQRSSGAHPSMLVEQFGPGASSSAHGTRNIEKLNVAKTHPILAKPPLEKFKSITQSSVQVELLSPLNQPIQHNRPLTVSCPEEITIPAGCLVELVEVKNVSGTRELELRLVPQLPGGPPLGESKSATAAGTAGRLSFKCRVTTEEDQPERLDRGVCTTPENGVPEPQIKESHIKAHSTNITVTIKDEPEVNERVLCSKASVMQTPGSSNVGFHGAWRSLAKPAPNPSESQRFTHQPCTVHKFVTNTTELVSPLLQQNSADKTTTWNAASKNIRAEGLECDRRALPALPNKREEAESSYQGLPVISSVFSLCPGPEAILNHIHTRVGILHKCAGEALTSSNLGSNGNVKNTDILACRHDLKTEEETGPLSKIVQKCSQILKENEDKLTINEDTKISEGLVSETLGDILEKSSQTCANDLKHRITTEQCSSLSDARQEIASDPALNKGFTTQPSDELKTKLEADISLPEQRENSHALSMNPTVALVRIPSLEFYSVLESAEKISEKLVEEESITARPVLCCTSNQQNLQGTAIKLVLKRKRSETENKDSAQDVQPGLGVCECGAVFSVLPGLSSSGLRFMMSFLRPVGATALS
ncbi:hypothetical protein P4O66_000559 [Electrophorus voltai]|uniref:Uncharacterized protein n=1 Tax=Electrophorus voltai TaxID=2609070 RepID=A0AAD9DXW3_9TELE|nr:hypothetical protein P4O66_000559 [Electrophorus voltai]